MTFDFAGIKTELQTRLRLLSDWANTLFFGVYDRITDLVAYISEKVVYIAEFYYKEAQFKNATLLSSLMNWCKFLDYQPHRKTGASGSVSITGSSTFSAYYKWQGEDVTLAKWTKLTDDNNALKVYISTGTTYYRNTIGNLAVDVKQGTPKSYTYIATGSVDEVIYLYTKTSDNDEIEVFQVDASDNIIYTYVKTSNIGLETSTSIRYYQVEDASDFTHLKLTFGNGVTTIKLNAGDRILIKYADTDGADGNIETAGTITKFVDTVYDINGNETTLYVTNASSISDGTDIESIEEIRLYAPSIYQTGYKCDNKTNWKAVVENIPYVYQATVWSAEDDGGSSLLATQNTVYVSAISTTGDALTTAQKTTSENTYLKPKKTVTETIVWYDFEKIYAMFDVTAKLETTASTTVDAEIKKILTDTYETTASDFMENIYESNFIGLINNVDSIVYHETDLYNMEKLASGSAVSEEILVSYTSTDTATAEDQVYLLANSFQIWVDIKVSGSWNAPLKIAHDSGGVFISDVAGYTISGSLDYINNLYSYVITGGILTSGGYVLNPSVNDSNGYAINIAYKTKDGSSLKQNDLRLPQRYQIRDIDEDYIFTTLTYV